MSASGMLGYRSLMRSIIELPERRALALFGGPRPLRPRFCAR